jgi:DNA-binding beta-propeller fold protein YncE
MTDTLHAWTSRGWVRPGAAAVLTGVLLLTAPGNVARRFGLPQAGIGRLVAYEPMAEACMMPAEEQRAARREAVLGTPAGQLRRSIKDPFPSFAAVAVDAARNEVVFTDESLFQVLVYDRLENAPGGVSKPKRVISGERTGLEFQSGVYVDEATGEIITANNDTRDKTLVFAPGASGDVEPVRQMETPHGTFGIVEPQGHAEVLLTTQHDSAVVTFRKMANGEESPIRMLQGNATRLADPHGIAYDPKDDVVFISNFGSGHDVSNKGTPRVGVPSAGNGEGKQNWPLGREWAIAGSGQIGAPSITVHRRDASGNTAPLREIRGPLTQFDWPTGLAFDPVQRELYVANDMGPSILVFDAMAKGNVAPKRVIKGPKTGLANPTAVAVDVKNRELWVANFGGHSGTAYDLTAAGDVAPKRTIRNAPPDTPSLMIGNPGAVAYDSKRENILVPN